MKSIITITVFLTSVISHAGITPIPNCPNPQTAVLGKKVVLSENQQEQLTIKVTRILCDGIPGPFKRVLRLEGRKVQGGDISYRAIDFQVFKNGNLLNSSSSVMAPENTGLLSTAFLGVEDGADVAVTVKAVGFPAVGIKL